MKPLNKKQRNASILKFVLVYILTVLFLVFPVYATFKIPEKQCDINEKSLEKVKKDYYDCDKERKRLSSGKNHLSAENIKELRWFLDKYKSNYEKVYFYTDTLDLIVNSGADKWDVRRIESVGITNSTIMNYRNKYREINDEFSEFLSRKK